MEDQKKKSLLKILGSKGTVDILQFLEKHGTAQYKDLQQFVSTHTLNARTKDLMRLGLIQHHFLREEVRREWYELTELGKKVLQWLSDLEKILE